MQLFKEFSNKRRQQARLTRDSVQKTLYGPVKISSIIPGETLYQISR